MIWLKEGTTLRFNGRKCALQNRPVQLLFIEQFRP